MLATQATYFWPSDVGDWVYTETWTNNATPSDTITASADFTVKAVPEPATCIVWSLFGGIGVFAGWRRRRLAA